MLASDPLLWFIWIWKTRHDGPNMWSWIYKKLK